MAPTEEPTQCKYLSHVGNKNEC